MDAMKRTNEEDFGERSKAVIMEAMEALTYLATPSHLRTWDEKSQFGFERVLTITKGLRGVLLGPDLAVIEDVNDAIDDLITSVNDKLDHVPAARFAVAALEEAKKQLTSHVDGTWEEPKLVKADPAPPTTVEIAPGRFIALGDECGEIEAKLWRRFGVKARVLSGCTPLGHPCFEVHHPKGAIHHLQRESIEKEASPLPVHWYVNQNKGEGHD